ncbi:hypothetical protein BCU70_18710 [Vibrio sp. 10N.286.49.C2]|uniref:SGNH/GDSL hydrolase family protein n=1 Tax=unclassified Vibrio TaxID=2614977 RepID=UPI000C83EB58|nr:MULTISPECIES: GDSL-type esterase/lipase family protein [unclassified Vibrio]PMH35176.1 hypothetical protein BCU70_18710 [Vibrio sp. 10N.286.49.C2]PMH57119.1 hypothetical protein BCU66_06410 [Vibrio sp. 10N.286.49.B1]PMH83589.1 hypothetical protein BCU58_14200 [Vibrio sp. 10N.286.48.B7]
MKKIILIGDSLTAGWGLPEGQNWSDSLASEFIDYQFINKGIPGDTTTGMLSRFQQQVIAQKPDIVVIFGGLNDLNWHGSINDVASNYNAMIAQAQYHNIAPVVMITSAIDPVTALPMFGQQQDVVDQIRHAVNTLSTVHAKKLEVMYGNGPNAIEIVDIYQAFEAYAAEHGYPSLYQADGIHLSEQGASLIFKQLKPVIATRSR